MWSVLWANTNELTYEILGIRPLLIDKLSNYCIPKDGVLLPRMDSYSSVLPLIVDPFITKGCNYYGLRRSILIIEAEGGDSWARVLYLATEGVAWARSVEWPVLGVIPVHALQYS
jgi:hypothetical protein